ncbi:ATP-binding protein [Bradyrhizobium roseum]|uniref:ATP-binding protein n=1 Tax=Bradyrhizobium roseum TaxID=3056648 RepID=UPI0026268D9A|nr:helicase HerA-like domain-containing protein [Bradyrhizobium roseus]WKA31628.1 DUF853 family protein [Bradyrhizobium roseus]
MKNPIPRSALEHHIAFVGKTGSGKTGSAKSGIIEPALAAEERVCIIDPTGAWWGLRLAADGKRKGLPIYVFGGDHGDFPLLANQGEMMAEAIGETSTPAILDTTRLKTGERMRFFTDFADTILRVNRGPLRLVIDEAHLFAPQAGTRGAGAMPDMLHAANNLISLGRSRGLRIVLISQRPAKVHKDSLTQVETLVAMRLIAPQDRKAVEEWIADQADKDTGKEIIASLPSLKTGEAWAWSPEAGFLKRVTFPMPSTYDSSKVQGTGKTAKRLAPIDVEKLQAKFAQVRTEAAAKDPKILQKRVAELEAQLRKPAPPAADPGAIAAAEVRGFKRGLGWCAAAYEAFDKHLALIGVGFSRAVADIKSQRTIVDKELQKSGPPTVKSNTVDTPMRGPAPPTAPRKPKPVDAGGDGNLKLGAERRPLAALAAVHPAGMTEAQWAIAAGLKRKGGTWGTYVSRLRTAGCIERRGDEFFATETGVEAAGDSVVPLPPPGPELVAFWKSKIQSIGPMLDALAKRYPDWTSREDLAAEINMAAGGGSFGTYISRLRSPGLIETDGGNIRCSPSLMG